MLRRDVHKSQKRGADSPLIPTLRFRPALAMQTFYEDGTVDAVRMWSARLSIGIVWVVSESVREAFHVDRAWLAA